MGRDKALLPFAGRPLIAHALSILEEAGLRATIAGADESSHASLASFAPVVDDVEPGLGPLGGICAALRSTSAHYAVFLSVDLPLLPSSLVVYLLRRARASGLAVTVVSVAGFSETFPAVVDRAALGSLEASLHAGTGGCFNAFESASAGLGQPLGLAAVELLAQPGQVMHPLGLPPPRWFLNLNTPEEVRRAEALITRDRRRVA